MKEYSIFEVIGPNMIGPSSSHTAGACKLGLVALKLAKRDVKRVRFLLHGSFAKTYRGHGTDKALLGGILGFEADDERIKNSFSLAEERGIEYYFEEVDLGDLHPNTVRIIIEKTNKEKTEIQGSSIGGGSIKVTEIDGVDMEFTGEYPTIIISHQDKHGIIARVTSILGENSINIAFMKVYRQNKGRHAYMIIETDDIIPQEAVASIKEIEGVANAYIVSL